MTKWADKYQIRLSFYGLLRYSMGKYGGKGLYENVLASDATVKGYAETAVSERDDMPLAVVNAGHMLKSLSQTMGDIDTCLDMLGQMAYPYVVYVLFAGSGLSDMANQHKEKFLEHIHRYPSLLDKLPERYRNIEIGETNNADSKQC